MSNKKISALASATQPLTGAELIPLVQGGVTVSVPVARLPTGTISNIIAISTTIAVDTSMIVASYLSVNAALTISGTLLIVG